MTHRLASQFLGTKILTGDESNLVRALEHESLFSDGEVAQIEQASSQRFHKKEKEMLLPYADILLAHIKEGVIANQHEHLESLKEVGECNVFSYTTLSYNQSLLDSQRLLGLMTPREQQLVYEADDASLETTMAVKIWSPNFYSPEEGPFIPSYTLYPKKVHRIFRGCDLLPRISLLFGPRYVAKRTFIEMSKKSGDFGWTQHLVTIRVSYKGDHLPTYEAEQILQAAKEVKNREVTTLSANEWCALSNVAEVEAPHPLLPSDLYNE